VKGNNHASHFGVCEHFDFGSPASPATGCYTPGKLFGVMTRNTELMVNGDIAGAPHLLALVRQEHVASPFLLQAQLAPGQEYRPAIQSAWRAVRLRPEHQSQAQPALRES
jgi:hypothetical protein